MKGVRFGKSRARFEKYLLNSGDLSGSEKGKKGRLGEKPEEEAKKRESGKQEERRRTDISG